MRNSWKCSTSACSWQSVSALRALFSLFRPGGSYQPGGVFQLIRQRQGLELPARFPAVYDGGGNGLVEASTMFYGVVAALAQHRGDRSQRFALRVRAREGLEIFRRLHQRRRIPRKGEGAGDIANTGIFLPAEIRRRLADQAVEGAQPLEPLAGVMHRLVRSRRLVAQDRDRIVDQFQPGATDFVVEGLFRVNSEGHPTGLRSDSPWRATGWRSACPRLLRGPAMTAERDRHSRHSFPLQPRSARDISLRKHPPPR